MMDKIKLDPGCPFCGGEVFLNECHQNIHSVIIRAACTVCGMEFGHVQDFAYSRDARVALMEGFLDVWKRRAEDG